MRKPLVQFCIAVLVVLVLTSLVFLWSVLTPSARPLIAALAPAQYGNLGTAIQATLGISVALAGALVAIFIANNTYLMLQHDSFRQEETAVQQDFERALRPIYAVATALGSLFTEFIASGPEKKLLIAEYQSRSIGAASPETLKHARGSIDYKKKLAQKLDRLCEALQAMNSSSLLATHIWLTAPAAVHSHVKSLGEQFATLDAANDVAESVNILRVCADHLRAQATDGLLATVVTPRLLANWTKTQEGAAFDHLAARNFLELGLELQSPIPDNGTFMNLGAAILLDIAQCIPDISALRQHRQEIYPTLREGIPITTPFDRLLENSRPRARLGDSLNQALTFIEEHKLALAIRPPENENS
jgi:hypothetical protein